MSITSLDKNKITITCTGIAKVQKIINFLSMSHKSLMVKPAQLVEQKYLTPTLLMRVLLGDAGKSPNKGLRFKLVAAESYGLEILNRPFKIK